MRSVCSYEVVVVTTIRNMLLNSALTFGLQCTASPCHAILECPPKENASQIGLQATPSTEGAVEDILTGSKICASAQ